jgi:hypothetical protein
MRHPGRFGVMFLVLFSAALARPAENSPLPLVTVNYNRTPAGQLKNGILELRLELRAATWYPEDDAGEHRDVYAFAGHLYLWLTCIILLAVTGWIFFYVAIVFDRASKQESGSLGRLWPIAPITKVVHKYAVKGIAEADESANPRDDLSLLNEGYLDSVKRRSLISTWHSENNVGIGRIVARRNNIWDSCSAFVVNIGERWNISFFSKLEFEILREYNRWGFSIVSEGENRRKASFLQVFPHFLQGDIDWQSDISDQNPRAFGIHDSLGTLKCGIRCLLSKIGLSFNRLKSEVRNRDVYTSEQNIDQGEYRHYQLTMSEPRFRLYLGFPLFLLGCGLSLICGWFICTGRFLWAGICALCCVGVGSCGLVLVLSGI